MVLGALFSSVATFFNSVEFRTVSEASSSHAVTSVTTPHCLSKAYTLVTELFGKMQPAFERHPGLYYCPGDEEVTGVFSSLMPAYSQRENWYAVTPYIAEFWSCLSNVGFLYAAYKNRAPELALAGLASMASHTVPKNWLLTVDKIGAVMATIQILKNYKTILQHPKLLLGSLAVGGIFAADVYLAATMHCNFPHVLWHIAAACGSHAVLQARSLN